MIKFRKQSYFDKYLDNINDHSRTIKKYGYYIKIPQKYDLRYWLLAALKKKIFDIETPKSYYNLKGENADEKEIQGIKSNKYRGGILVFPTDLDITKKYIENFHTIFQNRTIKSILQKYSNNILWEFGRRYRGVYKNKPRNKIFNAGSNTLEITGLNSVDLINIAVKLAVQLQQSILLIKDLNNETILILGKNLPDKKKTSVIPDVSGEEISDLDMKKLNARLNSTYKLCPSWQHTVWEMYDIYPKLNEFWIEDEHWYGK
jgi:hypothetical protein